jgi:hypothetical protein
MAGAVRPKVEAVDTEGLDAELSADEADGAAGAARLDVVDVEMGVRYPATLPTAMLRCRSVGA